MSEKARLARNPREQNKPAPVLASFVAIALCVLVPLWVIAETETPSTYAWAGAVVATVIAGVRFAWIIGSRRRRLFEMCTWLFFYSFLGVAPLVQLRDQVDTGTTPNLLHEYDWTAVTIVIIAEFSLMTGSVWAGRSDHQVLTTPRRVVSDRRANMTLMVLVAVAVGYVGVIGPSTLFSNRTQRGAVSAAAFSGEILYAIINAFVSLGLLVAIVAQLELQRRRKAAGRRPIFIPALLACVPLLMIVNPVGSPRFIVLTIALGLLAALGAYRSLGLYRVTSVSALCAMFMLFPVLDTFRRTLDTTIELSDPLISLKSGDFDSFSQIINTAHFVDVNGVTWGNQMLGVLLFWVPRSWWVGKPTDTGILLADFKGYGFTNLSAPLPAEFFINGGWIGLIVGLVFVGYLLRQWDARSELQLRALGTPTILGCVLPFYLIFVLRGSLLQATATLAVLLVTWFLTTSPRTPQPVSR